MYKQFFGLKENPFNVTPDPRYLYLTPHTQESLACMTYCVQARKGFVLLTGDVGTGKTTLLNKLLEWLRQEQIASAFVFNPRLNPFQFLDYALSDFGINCESRLKSAILAELNTWLLERYKLGTTAVLIVDEAQDASPELLEEIRLLTNLETPSGKLLQIVLSGQQELEMKLRLPEYRQLRQRITLRSKTHPLSPEETREYVATRLRIAGSDGQPIFAPDALDALHQYSEGIPRVINILCEDSLVSAYADHKPLIPREIMEAAARELELDIYPPTAPPPLAPRLDDIIKPGQFVSPPHRGKRMVGTTTTEASSVAQPTAKEPAAAATAPRGRVASPAEPVMKTEARTPEAASAREWETPEVSYRPEFLDEAVSSGPRPSAEMLTPKRAPAAAAKNTLDDEILQTLRTQEATPKPQPIPPTVKPPQPAPKPFVMPPPAPVKAKRSARRSWTVWVAVLAAVIASGVAAIFLLEQPPRIETPTRVSPPGAEAIAQSQVPEGAPTPAPVAPPEMTPSGTPTPAHPAEAPPATAPAPQLERKAQEMQPQGHTTRPARARRPTPARARINIPTQPLAASDTSAAPQVGGVVVWANIDGARITLDGRSSPVWVTPHELSNLPVGPHRVVVSKPGYEDVSGQVVIQEGRTTDFRAQLAAAGGEINIITNPPGLGVSIDGGPFRPSPVQATLGVGSHTYRIQLPNSRIYEGTFEMRTGAIITRRVDFSAGEWLGPTQ